MTLTHLFTTTNATPADIQAHSPADQLLPNPAARWVRCIDIEADCATVYRWLCQLTVAPYSFDLIDNWGRRSPTTLTPGADLLEPGQKFLIFEMTDFAPGSYIAGTSRPEFHRLYGTLSVSYQVIPSLAGTRLRAVACLGDDLPTWRRTLLGIGDRIMSGHQLHRLKHLSEGTQTQRG